jgi:SAM-dependent methyltransferase
MASYPDERSYRRIVAHYESCLERHGDSHMGVDWPDAADAATRYRVMLDVIRDAPGAPVSLLDFGCGAAHLLEFIQAAGLGHIDYRGVDISAKFVALCHDKFPGIRFDICDILAGDSAVEPADYVVMNGVFTEKRDLTQAEMERYLADMLNAVWPLARKGLAFNVMSKHVDWERDDLFHLPFDTAARLATDTPTRHFTFRQDYGLYEYTVYLYREPRP